MEDEEYDEDELRSMEIMNVNEVVRLQEWLIAHGLSYRDSVNCVRYIVGKEPFED